MWTARAIRFLPELLLLSFLIHHLGEQSYGIYVLAWSVLPILALLQQSIGSAVIKYSAAFLSQSRIGDVNRVLSTSCLLSTIFGTVGGLVPILVANFAPSDYFEKISHGNHEQLIFALNGVGIMIMLTFPLMPYAGILYALQRYDLFALVKTVGVYVRAGAIVCWFLFVGRSIEVLVIVSAVTEVLSGFCLAIIAYRLCPACATG